jgi:LysM repeat protein
MRIPVAAFRFAAILAIAQFATACAGGMSAMNPFDGDPNGPPPAPHMWKDAYAGDAESPDADVRDEPRRDRPARETRTADTRSDYDRSYGTNDVEAAELPPPSAEPGYDEPAPEPRREARADPVDDEAATRTLNTTRSRTKPTAASGKTHTVRNGEELSDIADNYGVREVDIIALNQLRPPYRLKSGQELAIPGGESGAVADAGDVAVPHAKPDLGGEPAAPAAKPKKEADAGSGPRFDWPVSGKIISGFGASGDGLYNEGINIAVPVGTPVRAAASGTIRYAGNELRGYGNLVLIEHAGGFVTAYAHNDSLKVKRGDKVARGDTIALSGKTGNVKTPQLHFEVRKGTESVDPRKYLVDRSS